MEMFKISVKIVFHAILLFFSQKKMYKAEREIMTAYSSWNLLILSQLVVS
jgi:hypothetical protein